MRMMIKVLVAIVLAGGVATVGGLYRQSRVAGVMSETGGEIRGLIVPHHEMAVEKIEEVAQRTAGEKGYQRVVVLAPNHFRPNSYTFTSARAAAEVPVDDEMVSRLADADSRLVIDQDLIENDHGVMVPMKYLQAAFPGAKFVPILVAPNFLESNLREWAARLAELGGEDTLYVASADFAHDMLENEAIEKDSESIAALMNFEYQTIFEFGDDHMDNPGGIATMLMIMERTEAKNFEVWYRGHGAGMLNNLVLRGTSYVTGVFRKLYTPGV